MRKFSTVHNGMRFDTFEFDGKHDGTFSYNEKKIIFAGSYRVTKMQGSYKYGEQLQMQILAPKGVKAQLKIRNRSDWNNMEINLPFEIIDDLIKALRELKNE